MHCFGVLALLVGENAKEVDEMVRYVILNSGAVANGVNVTQGRAIETEMGVGLKSMSICLDFDFFGNLLAEFGLG